MAYLDTTTGTNAGTAFDIPLNLYQRSGLPQGYQQNILSSLVPNLITATQNYPKMITEGYSALSDPNSSNMARAMRGFKDSTTGAFQGVLNKLANSGMMSSQTASDAMSQLGTSLNQQMFGGLANTAQGAEVEKLKALQQYPTMLGQLVGLGQSSENPFQPYQAVLDLLKTMI